jgi:hypothetical protein
MEINKHLEGLSGSELSSVLIDAFSRMSEGVSPASVLTSWERDRFVRPSDVSPKDFLLFDKTAYDAAEAFEAIELSPLCPFGTNTSVAPMSQKIVLSTIRSSEVVADSTNVLALECAIRRRALLKTDPKNASLVRLCASHRLVRVQKFNFPGATAHFRVFSLCSAGRDTGSHAFEVAAMVEHVSVMTNLLHCLSEKGFQFSAVRVALYGEAGVTRDLVSASLHAALPSVRMDLVGPRKSKYYPTTSFKLYATNASGIEFELADGGITQWTQLLVGSAKERLMISGIGTDRSIRDFKTS